MVSERVGSDKYSDRGMLTFHNNTKEKETLTNPLGITHTGSQASTSILFDAYVSKKILRRFIFILNFK